VLIANEVNPVLNALRDMDRGNGNPHHMLIDHPAALFIPSGPMTTQDLADGLKQRSRINIAKERTASCWRRGNLPSGAIICPPQLAQTSRSPARGREEDPRGEVLGWIDHTASI